MLLGSVCFKSCKFIFGNNFSMNIMMRILLAFLGILSNVGSQFLIHWRECEKLALNSYKTSIYCVAYLLSHSSGNTMKCLLGMILRNKISANI